MTKGTPPDDESSIKKIKYSIKISEGERHVRTDEKNYDPSEFCWECFNSSEGRCVKCKNYDKTKQLPREISFTAFQEGAKKKRSRPALICTMHCKYDIVRHIASKFGMKESVDNWNVLWSDFSISCEKVKNMRRYQKVNHFPGMLEICRKDLLARNLNRMQKIFPADYNFFPRTWLLPSDFSEIQEFSKAHRSTTYILKPDIGCKGKGIHLTKSIRHLAGMDRTICQEYVSKPYLVNGYKFDLRVYTLITSCDPLRLFVYNEGLARFATKQYSPPNQTNIGNMYMHLTNYSVNKFSRTYLSDPDVGSKRKITTLNEILRRQNHDVFKLWRDIDDMIIKTVFLALPTLQHNYRAAFPNSVYGKACFEILGFDLIFDRNLKPYLLEVNHSPSLHTDAPIDREVKEALLVDTFRLLNLQKNIKNKVLLEDRQTVTNRLLKDLTSSEWDSKNTSENVMKDQLRVLDEFEFANRGNYRKIYPTDENFDKYDAYYCQGTSSLFNDTFASRAREKAVRLAKENQEEVNKLSKRYVKTPENNESFDWIINKIKKGTIFHTKDDITLNTKENVTQSIPIVPKSAEKKPSHSISCHPVPLCREITNKPYEERKLMHLDKRLQILESIGALEKIHNSIKKHGQNRLMEEVKRIRKNMWSKDGENVRKRISFQHSLADIIHHIDARMLSSGEQCSS